MQKIGLACPISNNRLGCGTRQTTPRPSAEPLGVIDRDRIPMPKRGTLKVVAGIAASFTGLAGIIIFLSIKKIVSFEMTILMLVALFGLYIGFGILIAVYRLVSKLE